MRKTAKAASEIKENHAAAVYNHIKGRCFRTALIFMLSFISAGDAARVLAEKKYEHPSPEQVEEVRHEEGLDQPVLVQYGKWLDQALHGDFGKSYSTRKPAFEELKRYFPQTFKLAVTSFLLLMIVSVPLGILSAIYENRVLDKVIRILSSLSVSMPSFWIGLMKISFEAGIIPTASIIGGSILSPMIALLLLSSIVN